MLSLDSASPMDSFASYQPRSHYALPAPHHMLPQHAQQLHVLPPMSAVLVSPPSQRSASSSGSPPLSYSHAHVHGHVLPPPYPAHFIKQEPMSPPSPEHRHKDHATAAKLHRDHLRKVSHSAIERRRRERINDKIMQLKSLVPSCANQENLHKLSILQNAIEYIHTLKAQLEEQQEQRSSPRTQAQSLRSHHQHSSPPQAPHPYDQRRPSACLLPSPVSFSTRQSPSHSVPCSPSSNSEGDFDEHAGAHELLMLAGQRRMIPSPEPSEPKHSAPKMSVGSLLC
ncbi:hypothetical protein PhCBS80983_g00148 [Powellomyces hirtus]|uniref:BHLH domain-containing protein n=1 Tax=Powellomyces hirtus TaxID=109895 RepID=A0A507EF84_9FUNG|nr:hypothetical protein PhCBS80983_g00148 [Powellomyces hirtus]